MLKRRRGQNASINPALEEIEVDENTLRASLTCESCKKVLRDANTVVRYYYFIMFKNVLLTMKKSIFLFSSFSLSLSLPLLSLYARKRHWRTYILFILSLSASARDAINDNRRNVCTRFVSSASVRRLSSGNLIIVRRVFRLQEEEEQMELV